MPFAILLGIFLLLVFLGRKGQAGGRNALLARGLPARGLILSAGQTATDATVGGQRFEVRPLVLDVEIPGRPPYEVSLSPMIPRICEALPGATLDLRVDPAKPDNLVIIGPAGSSEWLAAATNVPGQTFTAPQTAGRAGCGTVVLVLVGLSLSLGTVLSFIGSAHTSSTAAPEPPTTATAAAKATVPPPRPTATHIPTSTPVTHHHPLCEEAARCCEMLGLGSCQAILTEPDKTCASVLADEKKGALKVGKRCQ